MSNIWRISGSLAKRPNTEFWCLIRRALFDSITIVYTFITNSVNNKIPVFVSWSLDGCTRRAAGSKQ